MAKFEVVSAFEDKDVILPKRGSGYSAGYDFHAVEEFILPPNMKEPYIMNTGVKVEMSENQYLAIYMRSSLGIKHGISMANGVPIIDADYYNNDGNEGHIMLALLNNSNKGFHVKPGDRIAQGILMEYALVEDDSYGKGELREGGIGSTGE